jgi:hypothetical protein
VRRLRREATTPNPTEHRKAEDVVETL